MKIPKDIKFEKNDELVLGDRYWEQTAGASMKGDVVRGLVELITNSDDSYVRLEEKNINTNGQIIISITRHYKSETCIEVLDFAEGMDESDMKKKFKEVGGKITSGFEESGGQRRGIMGRGARECIMLGDLWYRSIKNNFYTECIIKKPKHFKILKYRKADLIDREELGIKRGNGTLVIWEIKSQFKIPQHDFLKNNLSKHYSLRDIASSNCRKLILIDKNKIKEDTLSYKYPEGEEVFNNKITIEGYPRAEANLVINKSKLRIKSDDSPYWEGGFLIKSKHAIHDITGFSKDIENNLPYFEYYFGTLKCDYIDDLIIEFEDIMANKKKPTVDNPIYIIEVQRTGMAENHPFIKALYKEASRYLRDLIKGDEKNAEKNKIEIENHKTKERFQRLATEVSKFIRDNTEDINFEDENYLTSSEIKAGGIAVIPAGLKLSINEEKKIYIYVHPSPEQGEKQVIVKNNSDFIKLNTQIIGLFDRGDGILVGILTVKGVKEGSTKIKLTWGEIFKDLPILVISKNEQPQDIKEFQFEKDSYTIKEGKQKNIRIFVQWPEFIHGRVKIKISIDETNFCKLLTENILLDYDRKSKDIFGRRLANGVVKILGLKAGGPIILSATLKGKEIKTKIRVTPKKEFGKNFKIEFTQDDLGDLRAALIGNVIKINSQHKNIKRYLGVAPEFIGQNCIHFRLLMAELIADTVARRVLELNAQSHISEYKDMDIFAFYKKHREYMNNFLEIAHRVQIPDNEI